MMNDESRKRAPIPRYSFFIIHSSFFIVSYIGKVTFPVSAHVDI